MTEDKDGNSETAYENTGAVEQDRPDQETNVAPMREQLDHRWQDPLNKQNDSGLPERGRNPEFTGEPEGVNELEKDTKAGCGEAPIREVERAGTDRNEQNSNVPDKATDTNVEPSRNRRDPDGNNPEGETQDPDPGQRQKRNQGDKKDDDRAA